MMPLRLEGLPEETRERCRQALQSDLLREIERALAPLSPAPISLVGEVRYNQPLPDRWQTLLQRASETSIPDSAIHVARYVFLNAILAQSLGRVASLPVPGDIQHLFYDEFLFIAAPAQNSIDCLRPGTQMFWCLSEMVRLERFPAGQLQFRDSGFPRSFLLKMPPADVPRVLYQVYVRMGGRRPFYEPHNSQRRKFAVMFSEKEQRRSMFRIAETLERNPSVLGFMGEGWLHSPNLAEASPHLKFMMDINRELADEYGGVFTTLGPASQGAGFLVGDRRRIAKYQSGEWKPSRGLLLVPRRGMIAWAREQAPKL
jgi:hypothetical protein